MPAIPDEVYYLLPLLAIALERWLPLPSAWHPLRGVNLVTSWIGDRVNKVENGPRQQRLAGGLALLLFVLITSVTYSALYTLTLTPWLFDGILLYLCIQWQSVERDSQLIFAQLRNQRLSQARQMLKPWVLRDVTQLTSAQIAQATAEMLVLRLSRGWFSVLFWYAIGGTGLALLYRLTYQLHLNWNRKRLDYAAFGQPTEKLLEWFSWVPLQLLTLLLSCYGSIRRNWQSVSLGFRWPSPLSGQLLSIASEWIQAELGGTRSYDNTPRHFPLFGPQGQIVTSKKINTICVRFNLAIVPFILLLVFLTLIRYALLH